jgi:demethylmenaquinone methyltransferase/2-methoxy-6-polyprenyl-1,4-benzoquinol methylase
MPLLDHFSLLAPFYDRFARPKDSRKLESWLALPAAGRLLDVGGGTGRVSRELRGMVDDIVIADLSSGMLRQAATKDGLMPVCAHAERLPFLDGMFERVLMVDAFHHVCNQTETARDLWRVLKPGGRLVIEEPDIRTGVVKIVALLEKLAFMRSHFLPPPRIADFFAVPSARVHLAQEAYNAWIIVEKQ